MNCNTLQHTATPCNTLQHTATHGAALQHTATHCNTLQHTAPHCNTPYHDITRRIMCRRSTVMPYFDNTLQHTAAQYSTLHHTGAHCNTLQKTAPYLIGHDISEEHHVSQIHGNAVILYGVRDSLGIMCGSNELVMSTQDYLFCRHLGAFLKT